MRTNGSKQIQAINQILKQQRKSITKLKLFEIGAAEKLPKMHRHAARKQQHFKEQQTKISKKQIQQKTQLQNINSQSYQKERVEYADQDQLYKMNLSPVSRISLRNQKPQLSTSRKILPINQQTNAFKYSMSKETNSTSQTQFLAQNKHSGQIQNIACQKVQQYFLNHKQLFSSEKSPESIYKLMNPLLEQFNLGLKKPFIKQYKNCTYFGEIYESNPDHYGFLIFEQQKKVYYGRMNVDKKHGRGTEIDFVNNIVYKGMFQMGRKKGVFQVIKPTEKFIGELLNDKYQGKGKLFTDVSIYNGYFSKGLRHGEGEQFFPQTGLKISGSFIENNFTNNIQKLQEPRKGQYSRSLKKSRYKSKLYQDPQQTKKQSRLQKSSYNYQGYNYDLNASQDYLIKPHRTTNIRKSGCILKRRSEEQEQPLARIIR